MMQQLNAKLDQQTQVIEGLLRHQAQKRAPPKAMAKARGPVAKPMNYYVQAVIPGRAWLIATNGSTLTVRQGSSVRGYGVVQSIDAVQGRVNTSSGRVIRFSQDDS